MSKICEEFEAVARSMNTFPIHDHTNVSFSEPLAHITYLPDDPPQILNNMINMGGNIDKACTAVEDAPVERSFRRSNDEVYWKNRYLISLSAPRYYPSPEALLAGQIFWARQSITSFDIHSTAPLVFKEKAYDSDCTHVQKKNQKFNV